jgi:competence protein ComEA
VVELLRPPPDRSWRQRAGGYLGAITLVRLATTAGAVLLVAVTAWWLLRTPAPPVERSLPSARSSGSGVGAPDSRGSSSGGSSGSAPVGSSGSAPVAGDAAAAPTSAPLFVVQAAGAVAVPGVYRVASGARVVDVVTAAGGPTADADLQAIALAAKVTDGARIYVPRVGEIVTPGSSPAGAPGDSGGGPDPPIPAAPLDLNQATATQLDDLPGVGPTTAAAIIDYRTTHGPFVAVDDLLEVRGIGPAKLDAFRDLVRVA